MCIRLCMRVCISTSVGAMRAPCQPEPAAASRASMATAVLPDPTSPCSRRIMGAGPCMSLKICTPQDWSGFAMTQNYVIAAVAIALNLVATQHFCRWEGHLTPYSMPLLSYSMSPPCHNMPQQSYDKHAPCTTLCIPP